MKNLLIAALMLPLIACGSGEPVETGDEQRVRANHEAGCQRAANAFRLYDLVVYSRTGEVVRVISQGHSCTKGGAQIVVRFDDGKKIYVYVTELTQVQVPE